jgi:hypothetical protein
MAASFWFFHHHSIHLSAHSMIAIVMKMPMPVPRQTAPTTSSIFGVPGEDDVAAGVPESVPSAAFATNVGHLDGLPFGI